MGLARAAQPLCDGGGPATAIIFGTIKISSNKFFVLKEVNDMTIITKEKGITLGASIMGTMPAANSGTHDGGGKTIYMG